MTVLPYALPLGRILPPLDMLASSLLNSRALRSAPPVSDSTASSVPLAPGSSLKTGLSSSSSGILSRLSSEILERACSFFRRPGGRRVAESSGQNTTLHSAGVSMLIFMRDI